MSEPVYEGPCQPGTQWVLNNGEVIPIRTVKDLEWREYFWVVRYMLSNKPGMECVADEKSFLHRNVPLSSLYPTEEELEQAADRIINFQNYRERHLSL